MKLFNFTFSVVLIGMALLGLVVLSADAVTLEDVERSFYPYKNSVPTFDGLEAGMTITAENVEQFKPILDPEMLKMIKDGWFDMKVGKTTSFELHQNYINATKENLGKVSLGDKVGQINGFVAGRPFPEEPDINDPRAGEKLAWNFKYGYNWGDGAAVSPFYWKYKNIKKNKVERSIKYNFHFINFRHRVQHEPVPEVTPNPSQLFRATYGLVLEPYDVQNTQLLIHRSDDDQKRDNSWLYLGFQRRVRRLATGQTTDAFLGSDVMIEDFEGYNGRVCDMTWTYKGTETIMMPFYNHNDLPQLGLPLDAETHKNDPDGFQMVSFSGKGTCYPDITWQLRKVYKVDSVPVDPSHPIGKRVHYMDAQTFTLPRTNLYDRTGKLWKVNIIGQAHPDHHLAKNKGTGVAVDDAYAMIDIQAMRCTTAHFKGQVDPSLSPVDMFSVQNMRVTGR